jgi:hypothetical protein
MANATLPPFLPLYKGGEVSSETSRGSNMLVYIQHVLFRKQQLILIQRLKHAASSVTFQIKSHI